MSSRSSCTTWWPTAWSLMVLSREAAEYYQRYRAGDLEVPLPPSSFSQYVSAERRWLASQEAADSERYWREQLAGAPPAIELPLRPRPAKPDFRTGAEVRKLTAAETGALRALAQRYEATPFMAVLAAFYAVLREITGSGDVVIGIDSVNRSWPGSEELIGTFVNQLPDPAQRRRRAALRRSARADAPAVPRGVRA